MSAETADQALPVLLTVREAAERLGRRERWLADRIRAGEVEHTRIGRSVRLTPAQLAAFVAASAHRATAAAGTAAPARNAWGRAPRRRAS